MIKIVAGCLASNRKRRNSTITLSRLRLASEVTSGI